MRGLTRKEIKPDQCVLVLSGYTIYPEGAKLLGKKLAGNLQSLVLRNCVVEPTCRGKLERAISTSTSLTSLTLENTQIDVHCLTQNTNITTLCVTRMGLTHISKMPSLTSLNVSYNQLGDRSAHTIARMMHSLTSLDVSHNCIGNDGFVELARALPSAPLVHLSVGYNDDFGDFDDRGERELTRAVSQNHTLVTCVGLSPIKVGPILQRNKEERETREIAIRAAIALLCIHRFRRNQCLETLGLVCKDIVKMIASHIVK